MNPYVESSSFSLSRLLLFVCLHIKKGWDESKVMVCPINSQFVPPRFLNFVFLLLCFLASHGLVLQVIRKVMMRAYILREELRECLVKESNSITNFDPILSALRPSWSIFPNMIWPFFVVSFPVGIFVRRLNTVWCYRYQGGLYSLRVRTPVNLNCSYTLYLLVLLIMVLYFNN